MSATIDDILVLGDPRLYEKCDDVETTDLPLVKEWVVQLKSAMSDIRRVYNFGRGIAAPQLGIMKRLVYIDVDQPIIMINPVIIEKSKKVFELWDDCMSFPNLLVRVRRYQSISVKYYDENWEEQKINAKDDLSELIQHEVDHLDGILCTMRAIDERSFKWKK